MKLLVNWKTVSNIEETEEMDMDRAFGCSKEVFILRNHKICGLFKPSFLGEITHVFFNIIGKGRVRKQDWP